MMLKIRQNITFYIIAIAMLTSFGCSTPPQVGPDQIRLVEATWTAVAGKDMKALESVAQLVETEHQAGRLTDHQRLAFQAIRKEAQARNWKSAEDLAFDFLHAQGP